MMVKFQQLISSETLQLHIEDQNLVILDASIPPVGNMAHATSSWPDVVIPGSRRFLLNTNFSDQESSLPHTMPSALAFEKAAQALGINNESQIVVYDNLGLFSAARAWFMFKAMGHKNIAVLDGGLPQWLKQKMPVVQAQLALLNMQGNFTANPQNAYFCDQVDVEKAINTSDQTVLDARSHRRFFGLDPEPRAGMRSGHMPTAINLPYTDLMTDGLFKPLPELETLFESLNLQDNDLIMTCGSGVTACILALAADMAGQGAIRVYDGSWSEWGASKHLPVTQ